MTHCIRKILMMALVFGIVKQVSAANAVLIVQANNMTSKPVVGDVTVIPALAKATFGYSIQAHQTWAANYIVSTSSPSYMVTAQVGYAPQAGETPSSSLTITQCSANVGLVTGSFSALVYIYPGNDGLAHCTVRPVKARR